MRRAFRALLPLALLAIPLAARAQMDTREGIALQNQILDLRRQVQGLQDQVARGGGGGGGFGGSFLGLGGSGRPAPAPSGGGGNEMIPQLLDRVQTLEEEVRRMRGQIDEMQNVQQRQFQDLSKQIADLNFKLGGTPGGAATPPSTAPAPLLSPPAGALGAGPAPALAPPTGPVPRTPERSIQEGNAALARRDYAAAEAAAREVLSNARTSPRAYDAQFLLAQALAGRRDNAQAAIAYDDAYNRSRTGGHAQDALIGLADSLNAINEKRAACETLAKLGREFPSPRPDVRDSARAIRGRAGCA